VVAKDGKTKVLDDAAAIDTVQGFADLIDKYNK